MCKVLMIPAIKEDKRKETEDFIYVMSQIMTKNNNDGLGYAAIDDEGKLFGERWFVNNMAFRDPNEFKRTEFQAHQDRARSIVDKWGDALKKMRFGAYEPFVFTGNKEDVYNNFGEDPKLSRARAITLHTRYATCEKNLTNVHPFVDQDTSVIHNGVISNHKEFDLKLSTCDSESILISYLDNNVNNDPTGAFHNENGVKEMANALDGYYATGIFSRDVDGNRILDVVQWNNRNLSVCYIYDLETYVIATSDHDIKEACKELGYLHDGTIDLNEGFLTRINPFNGEVMLQVKFEKEVKKVEHKTYPEYKPWEQYFKQNEEKTKVLPHRHHQKVSNIDQATMNMLRLKPTIKELNERAVEEFKMASGYWE